MKIRRLYALLTILLAAVVIGLALSGVIRTQRNWNVDLYAGQEGGVYLPLAKSIASLIEQENPRLKVTVHSTEGSAHNLQMLAAEKSSYAIAIVQNDTPTAPSTANQIQALVPLHIGALHFIAPLESSISNLSDLRGKKIAVGTEGSGSITMVRALLEHFEIEDCETIPSKLSEACARLESAEVDAIMMTMGLKSERFEELTHNFPVKLVGLGNDIGEGGEIAGFKLSWPFISSIEIPKYAYQPGTDNAPSVPPAAVPTIGVRSILMTNRDFPETIARQITRTIAENRAALIRENPETARMADQASNEILQYPLHPGAQAYQRRNEPGFLQQNAEVLGFLLSLLATFWGFALAMRRWLNQRQKDRIDVFYQRLGEIWRIIEQRWESAEANEASDFRDVRKELREIRDEALILLADEKLPADESFRIFQDLWEQCMDRIERFEAKA